MAKAKTEKEKKTVSAPQSPPEPAPAPQPPPEPVPAPQPPPEPAPVAQPPPEPVTMGLPAVEPSGVDLFDESELTGVPIGIAPGSPESQELLPGETDAQRKIRLGKKPTGRPLGSKTQKKPEFNDVVAASQNFRGMAEMTFGLATGMLTTIFGPEWQPANPEEKEGVVKPLEDYFRVKQIPDLPPGWVLVIAVLAYSAPRLHHPNTRNKIVATVNKIRGKKPQ